MSNTVLKKEFQQRDVQRLRNLMTGKHGDKTIVGVGYTKNKNSIMKEMCGRKMAVNGP